MHDKDQDRTPIYRAVRDDNGYQVRPQDQSYQPGQPRPVAGKRPRISESSQRVDYNADRYERQKPVEGRPYRPLYPASYSNANRTTGQRQQPPYSGGGNYSNRPQYGGKTGDAKYP
ncbi:MAG: hypothetical protein LBF85_00645, partial [Tannerella sp.]|nr:hypothetical protein [Tannerella sp.]